MKEIETTRWKIVSFHLDNQLCIQYQSLGSCWPSRSNANCWNRWFWCHLTIWEKRGWLADRVNQKLISKKSSKTEEFTFNFLIWAQWNLRIRWNFNFRFFGVLQSDCLFHGLFVANFFFSIFSLSNLERSFTLLRRFLSFHS